MWKSPTTPQKRFDRGGGLLLLLNGRRCLRLLLCHFIRRKDDDDDDDDDDALVVKKSASSRTKERERERDTAHTYYTKALSPFLCWKDFEEDESTNFDKKEKKETPTLSKTLNNSKNF